MPRKAITFTARRSASSRCFALRSPVVIMVSIPPSPPPP
nr:MAG TPA: hypothetical protein [Caudoviricetes sp.]